MRSARAGRRGRPRSASGRAGGRRGRRIRSAASLAVLLVLLVLAIPWVACVSRPPRDAEDICSIFREKRRWHRDATRSYERWGVPQAVQLAIIHQESSFRATARPPRSRVLWLFPGPRPSSAYGYGQVVDPTWESYLRSAGGRGASRSDFGDVVDFIGWYGDLISRRTGIAKEDARSLYLAYHEGPAGYRRGSHHGKSWLQGVARQVGERASRYQRQYDGCRESLSRRRFLGIF